MNKNIFILSGMSGCGKSTLLECCRWYGFKALKSFNKFLLDMRFGYGKSGKDFLIMNMFMQMYQVKDSEWNPQYEIDKRSWIIERSVIDGYYFSLYKLGYSQSETEIEDMNHIIKSYFMILTEGFKHNIVVVDIWNKDRNWIQSNLNGEWSRESIWNSVDDYLSDQNDYKYFYFNILNELDIPYNKLELNINDISKFTKVDLDKFVTEKIVNYDIL